MLVLRGLTVADLNNMTLGMCINYMHSYDRLRSGKKEADPEQHYRYLKEIEPVFDEEYRNGNISEEKYKEFKRQIREWEEYE